jgi:hypothetical protein
MDDVTYSTNSARHSSSFLVKAYRPRHVPPRRSRVAGSRYSRNCEISSSGKYAIRPKDVLRLTDVVRALPAGRNPNGWRLTSEESSKSSMDVSSSRTTSILCLFTGGKSWGRSSCMSSVIVVCVRRDSPAVMGVPSRRQNRSKGSKDSVCSS